MKTDIASILNFAEQIIKVAKIVLEQEKKPKGGKKKDVKRIPMARRTV
jgi:predicted metal-binding protein